MNEPRDRDGSATKQTDSVAAWATHPAVWGPLLVFAMRPPLTRPVRSLTQAVSIAAFAILLAANTAMGQRSDALSSAVAKFEKDVAALESLDRETVDPPGAVLLIGSSSIRLWQDADVMLAPYPVIRRGYGGARYDDLAVFAKRLIRPHTFAAMVVFVGNDITGGTKDREPDEVEVDVRKIVAIAREHQPEAAVLLVEVTPTPVRFAVWPKIRALNAMLREVALTEPNVFFVATAEAYLDADDQPRQAWFRDDRLHQNDIGYQVWASLIKRRLDEVLGQSPVE